MKVRVTIISNELTVKYYDSLKEFEKTKLAKSADIVRYSEVNSDGSLNEPVYIKGNATDEYNYMRSEIQCKD